jgi:RND family efflux transporter MFP subunit
MLVGKRPTDPQHNRRAKFWVTVIIIAMVILAAIGIVIRLVSHAHLASQTQENAIPTVSVVKPALGPETDDLTLPGTLRAFIDAPLYARTNGYLKDWYFDIGQKVKKGQLIALIETPELDQQLDQAKAALGSARANYDLAVVTNKRYQALVKTDAVSKQEADQSASTEAARKADVDAAAANVKHYEALQSFEKLYAPFDGVVTERNTDIGQLVSAGLNGNGPGGAAATGHDLFRVASIDKLRTFIPVPQNQSPYVTAGTKADLTLVERPGQPFDGVVARVSNAIDSTSRTMLAEVDIDNRNGELLPGAYVNVHLQVPSDNVSGAVRVPANTLVFRAQGLQVAVVGSDNKIQLHSVQVGRDFGNSVELVSGVTKDDQIVVNPPDSLAEGQQVKIAVEEPAKATAAQDGHSDKTSDDKKSDATAQPKDVKPAHGSTEPVEKASRKPADKDRGQKGDQTGSQPASGQTMPGTDGTGAK